MPTLNNKKILIVSHNSLSHHANNGKTLSSMFGGWSPGNIAQVFFQNETPESDRFTKFFRIRDVDIIKRGLSFGIIKKCGKPVQAYTPLPSDYNNYGYIKKELLSFARRLNGTKVIIRDLIYGSNLWLTKSFISWIGSFKPEGVFLVGGNYLFSFRFASYLAIRYNIPLYIYITDDYILNPNPSGVFAKYLQNRLLKCYRQYLPLAKHVFVIGDEMASEFKSEFGRDFIPVMNAVSIPSDFPKKCKSEVAPDYLDIVYVGGLHLGRDESILRFNKIILNIAHEAKCRIKLSVYSLSSPSGDFINSCISDGIFYGGALNHREVLLRVSTADFVLHVESFEKKYRELTKLSISTKIPEYFASGSCLLAYGPSEVASIKLIQDNNLGVVFSENSNQAATISIVSCFRSADARKALSLNGFSYAKKNFDINVVRNMLDSYII